MKKNKIFTLFTLAFTIVIMTSCGITSHPNEKLIIGTWRPVKVEIVVDSSALKAASTLAGNSGQKPSQTGRPAGEGGNTRKEAIRDRLIQAEMNATMEIFANKTAIKNYAGKPVHATWKMNGKGTRIVAKNVENKMRFVIEILEITKEQIVVIEHISAGDVKVTYKRQL